MARLANSSLDVGSEAPKVDLSMGAQIGPCVFCTHGVEHRHDRPITDEDYQRLRDHLDQEEAKRLKA